MDVDLATIRDIATTVAAILGSIKILQELRQNKKRSRPGKRRKR